MSKPEETFKCPECRRLKPISATPLPELMRMHCKKGKGLGRKQVKRLKNRGIPTRRRMSPSEFLRLAREGKLEIHWACNACLGQEYLVADTSRQTGFGWDGPIYFYRDQKKQCKDCGKPFTFSRYEQRVWYEFKQIPREVYPVRCKPCRQLRWAHRQLNELVPRIDSADAEMLQDIARYYRMIGSEEKARWVEKRIPD